MEEKRKICILQDKGDKEAVIVKENPQNEFKKIPDALSFMRNVLYAIPQEK